ncbi:MAG: FAD-binding domain-containing protein [Planctomycetia bacterium]
MLDLTDLVGLPRAELSAGLVRRFPDVAGRSTEEEIDAAVGVWARGGRGPALERLAGIDPEQYGRTRNHVGGAVTRLSPWLRHGVLSLAEVRDAALAGVRRPEDAAKLIAELGWRDYWRQVYAALGSRIHESIEPAAQGSRMPSVGEVPADVLAARTGMECIDAFVRQLHRTGWLHNHERMWLASWLVHVRGVRWQAGADWFVTHLLDGDPASNHLSWQWVAGTFAAKPYIFNRENLETFTAGVHCAPCGLRGRCSLEGSYEELSARWFVAGGPAPRPPWRIPPPAAAAVVETAAIGRPLVWLTLESVGGTSPAAAAHPAAPRLVGIDPAWIAAERPSLNRLVFLFECLGDSRGVEVVAGDLRETVAARASAHGCDGVVVAETPCPRVRRAVAAINAPAAPAAGESAAGSALRVAMLPWPRFCDRSRVKDIGRFSRFWQQVSHSAMQPTAQPTMKS